MATRRKLPTPRITCDSCVQGFTHPDALDERRCREKAAESGWVVANGKDLCKVCVRMRTHMEPQYQPPVPPKPKRSRKK